MASNLAGPVIPGPLTVALFLVTRVTKGSVLPITPDMCMIEQNSPQKLPQKFQDGTFDVIKIFWKKIFKSKFYRKCTKKVENFQ